MEPYWNIAPHDATHWEGESYECPVASWMKYEPVFKRWFYWSRHGYWEQTAVTQERIDLMIPRPQPIAQSVVLPKQEKTMNINSINLARQIAVAAHEGQMYGSESYVYHLNGVMMFAMADPATYDLGESVVGMAALLHDTLEDTDLAESTIRNLFGNDVADAVVLLTRKEGQDESEYIDKIKQNRLALVVKKADALFNLKESALNEHAKRVQKYTRILNLLVGE